MKCPFCGDENTKVIDSRPSEETNSIRRRRQCEKCNKRFTTYEKVETIPLVVIKKGNVREAYDRSKIEAGVFRSCHKRPISIDQINSVVDDIEKRGYNTFVANGPLIEADVTDLSKFNYKVILEQIKNFILLLSFLTIIN